MACLRKSRAHLRKWYPPNVSPLLSDCQQFSPLQCRLIIWYKITFPFEDISAHERLMKYDMDMEGFYGGFLSPLSIYLDWYFSFCHERPFLQTTTTDHYVIKCFWGQWFQIQNQLIFRLPCVAPVTCCVAELRFIRSPIDIDTVDFSLLRTSSPKAVFGW